MAKETGEEIPGEETEKWREGQVWGLSFKARGPANLSSRRQAGP